MFMICPKPNFECLAPIIVIIPKAKYRSNAAVMLGCFTFRKQIAFFRRSVTMHNFRTLHEVTLGQLPP
jgi:hypothetical protein